MTDDRQPQPETCPKCGAAKAGEGPLHYIDEGRTVRHAYYECGSWIEGGELHQAINDCRISELESELAALREKLAEAESGQLP